MTEEAAKRAMSQTYQGKMLDMHLRGLPLGMTNRMIAEQGEMLKRGLEELDADKGLLRIL